MIKTRQQAKRFMENRFPNAHSSDVIPLTKSELTLIFWELLDHYDESKKELELIEKEDK